MLLYWLAVRGTILHHGAFALLFGRLLRSCHRKNPPPCAARENVVIKRRRRCVGGILPDSKRTIISEARHVVTMFTRHTCTLSYILDFERRFWNIGSSPKLFSVSPKLHDPLPLCCWSCWLARLGELPTFFWSSLTVNMHRTDSLPPVIMVSIKQEGDYVAPKSPSKIPV